MKFLLFALALVFTNVDAQTKPQEGVEVQKSRLLLLPSSTVERSATQQYQQLMRAASQKNLLNNDKAQLYKTPHR